METPATFRIRITTEASSDLAAIFDYIWRDSAQNARRVADRILAAVDGLEFMPSRFKIAGKSRATGASVHAMVVRPYIVYYRVEEALAAVFIVTIRHGARRQPKSFS